MLLECHKWTDSIIQEIYKEQSLSTILKEIKDIKYCVIYDMLTTYNSLYEEDIEKKVVKLGLALLLPSIDDTNMLYIKIDYDVLCSMFDTGILDDFIRSSITLKIDNPLKLNEANNKYCLPVALKIMGSKLSDKYCITLYRFVLTLSKAEKQGRVMRDTEPVSKQKTLMELYYEIFNPIIPDKYKYNEKTFFDGIDLEHLLMQKDIVPKFTPTVYSFNISIDF
jgi:hypothetical protein